MTDGDAIAVQPQTINYQSTMPSLFDRLARRVERQLEIEASSSSHSADTMEIDKYIERYSSKPPAIKDDVFEFW